MRRRALRMTQLAVLQQGSFVDLGNTLRNRGADRFWSRRVPALVGRTALAAFTLRSDSGEYWN